MASKVLHRQLKAPYPVVAAGEGVWFRDREGKRYLDACCGAAVSCLGHGHPKVIEAIKAQLDRVAYAHTGYFTSTPAEELADWLIARAPEGFGRVAFVSGGSEANEAALKLARQVHLERGEESRTHFIARRQSYHGATLATLALGDHKARRAPYEALIAASGEIGTTSHIAPCYPYRLRRADETAEAYGLRAAGELEAEILRIGPERVAAFVAETIAGASLGAVPAAPGYFREVRRICDKYGVFLILDEVMCGMGRAGSLFACTQEGVVPDMITIAKGLGGGYQPIGALLVRESLGAVIAERSGALMHGHTYMGHPVACAAALAVQRTVEEEGLLTRVRERGAQLKSLLADRLAAHPHVGDIRGRGLFVGIELVEDRASKAPFPRAARLAERIKERSMALGLMCYPGSGTADGVEGDHVLLAPPFIVAAEELTLIVDRLVKALDEVFDDMERKREDVRHGRSEQGTGKAAPRHGRRQRRATV